MSTQFGLWLSRQIAAQLEDKIIGQRATEGSCHPQMEERVERAISRFIRDEIDVPGLRRLLLATAAGADT